MAEKYDERKLSSRCSEAISSDCAAPAAFSALLPPVLRDRQLQQLLGACVGQFAYSHPPHANVMHRNSLRVQRACALAGSHSPVGQP